MSTTAVPATAIRILRRAPGRFSRAVDGGGAAVSVEGTVLVTAGARRLRRQASGSGRSAGCRYRGPCRGGGKSKQRTPPLAPPRFLRLPYPCGQEQGVTEIRGSLGDWGIFGTMPLAQAFARCSQLPRNALQRATRIPRSIVLGQYNGTPGPSLSPRKPSASRPITFPKKNTLVPGQRLAVHY